MVGGIYLSGWIWPRGKGERKASGAFRERKITKSQILLPSAVWTGLSNERLDNSQSRAGSWAIAMEITIQSLPMTLMFPIWSFVVWKILVLCKIYPYGRANYDSNGVGNFLIQSCVFLSTSPLWNLARPPPILWAYSRKTKVMTCICDSWIQALDDVGLSERREVGARSAMHAKVATCLFWRLNDTTGSLKIYNEWKGGTSKFTQMLWGKDWMCEWSTTHGSWSTVSVMKRCQFRCHSLNNLIWQNDKLLK